MIPKHLSSRENPKIQRIMKLSSSVKERWTLGRYLVEGPKFVGDLLKRGGPIEALYVSEDQLDSTYSLLQKEALSASFDFFVLPEVVFRRVSDAVTSQGVIAEVNFDKGKVGVEPTWINWLALNGVQDPGNLGTLVRSAVAVGGIGLILDEASADPFSPKAVRASAGLVSEIYIVRVRKLSGVLEKLKQNGYAIYGICRDGDRPYYDLDFRRSFVSVLGAEGQGIDADLTGIFDFKALIPTSEIVESINVSIAGSLVIFESSRKKHL